MWRQISRPRTREAQPVNRYRLGKFSLLVQNARKIYGVRRCELMARAQAGFATGQQITIVCFLRGAEFRIPAKSRVVQDELFPKCLVEIRVLLLVAADFGTNHLDLSVIRRIAGLLPFRSVVTACSSDLRPERFVGNS